MYGKVTPKDSVMSTWQGFCIAIPMLQFPFVSSEANLLMSILTVSELIAYPISVCLKSSYSKPIKPSIYCAQSYKQSFIYFQYSSIQFSKLECVIFQQRSQSQACDWLDKRALVVTRALYIQWYLGLWVTWFCAFCKTSKICNKL